MFFLQNKKFGVFPKNLHIIEKYSNLATVNITIHYFR